MARRTKKSGLLGRSLKKHAKDETTYGPDYSNLPGGITGGIAKLVEAKIGIYQKGANKGKQFIFLSGTVVEPKKAMNEVKAWKDDRVVTVSNTEMVVEGLFTNQTLPLCEVTRISDGVVVELDDNVESALNEVRKIGGEDCTEGIDTEEDLIEVLKSLKEEEIYFKFSTSASEPSAKYPDNPRVWENWRGSTDYVEDEDDDSIVDDTEDDDAETTEDDSDDSELSLTELGVKADAEDESSQLKLDELATEAGIDSNRYAKWSEVAEALESDDDDSEDDDAEDDDGMAAPKKGQVFKYKPPRARKAVDCEVMAVFSGKETCNLKNLDTGKTYKSVAWGDLT